MKTTSYTILIAALGMMATLMSVELKDLATWDDLLKPDFIGTLLAHFGTVIGAYTAGRLTPANRDGKRTRYEDSDSQGN